MVEARGTQAIVALLVAAITFLGISIAIHRPGVESLDLRVTRALQTLTDPVLTIVMWVFTFMGNTATLVALALGTAGWLYARKRPLAAFLTVVTLIGLPLNMILKEAVGRPRPDKSLVNVVTPTIGLSFPSGHAMASTMFYGFLAVLAWMHLRGSRGRRRAVGILALTAVMVSVSRIYLGAHWLSDVVGGWTAGLFCLVILVEIYKHWGKKELAKEEV